MGSTVSTKYKNYTSIPNYFVLWANTLTNVKFSDYWFLPWIICHFFPGVLVLINPNIWFYADIFVYIFVSVIIYANEFIRLHYSGFKYDNLPKIRKILYVIIIILL